MTITTEHPSSSYGVPVILADDGTLMDTGPGIRVVRESLGMSRIALSDALGVSKRTLEAWEYGRAVPVPKRLYALKTILEAQSNRPIEEAQQ